MDKLIKSLYPVSYDNMVFLFSKRGMLMDIHVRQRGWGWIQYLDAKLFGKKNCGEIQDAIGTFIADAINEKIERDFNNK